MAQQGFGQRVRRAWHLWASQNVGTVTYEDFAAAIAKAEERPEPYSISAISEWIAERSEPKARTYRAIASLTGFREAWLMKGELPERTGDDGQGAKLPTNGTPTRPRTVPTTPADPNVYATTVKRTPGLRRKRRRPKPDDRSARAG